MEIGIPFSKMVGKLDTKIEFRFSTSQAGKENGSSNSVSRECSKRKTKMEVRIPFSRDTMGKRLALGYTDFIMFC